jgi:hypothetical protein
VHEHDYSGELRHIICSNDWLMMVLEAVRDCAPPDWLIGGGVIRNVVWDHLHGYSQPTPVADVDVAFFDMVDLSREREQAIENQLLGRLPRIPWDVKNQAAVHLWYPDVFGSVVPALTSVEEAVGTWPETATSVGVRLSAQADLLIVAPHGLNDLFRMVLRRNPCRVSLEQFRQRARDKAIQQKWPRVRVLDC